MKAKAKVLLGLSALTAMAVGAGSVGTMAWFYSNSTVTASGLSMSINGPSATVQIAPGISNVAESDWGSSLDISETDATLSPTSLCTGDGNLVSTAQESLFAGTSYKFMVPSFVDASGSGSGASSVVTNDAGTNYYIRKDFSIRYLQNVNSSGSRMSFKSFACYINFSFTTTVSSYSPIHASLMGFLVNEPQETSNGVVASVNGYGSCTLFHLASSASALTGTVTVTGWGSQYQYTQYTANTPERYSLFIYVDGNNSGCISANALNFGTVGFSFSVSEPVLVESKAEPE